MITEEDMLTSQLMLSKFDYPSYFVNNMHPDDGKISTKPMVPEVIYHQDSDHNRLLLRMSFQLSKNEYLPVTFVCDTGAPNYFYVSKNVLDLISHRFRRDDLQNRYMVVNGRKVKVEAVPYVHEGSNIVGLQMLARLGLKIKEGGFTFKNLPEYF